jgi:hypothetical protein
VRSKKGAALPSLLVTIAALAVFAPVVRYGFVYDDHWTIVRNQGLSAPLSRVLTALFYGQANKLGLADATRPTMVLSTWTDRALFGLSPAGYHVHSLLLYAAIALVAHRVLLVLLARPRAALFGALFFALAPLHAEAVAAVNYREDLLASLFSLIVLAIVFAPRENKASFVPIAAVTGATLLALGAKESAFVLPLLVLGIAWARGDDLAYLRRREALLTAVVVVTALVLNWRLGVPDDVPRAASASLVERTFATARYETIALFSSTFPVLWSPERGRLPPASPLFLVLLAGAVVLAAFLRRRPRMRPFAVAIVIALVAPMASAPLAGPVNEIADRYFFLGILGGAIAFGTTVDRAPRKIALPIAGAVLVACAAVASFARSVFYSDHTLWSAAVARAPDSARAWTGLSRVRRIEGDLDGADAAAARAIAIDPLYAPARLTRAYNFLARGDVVSARAVLLSLTRKLPGLAHAETCAALEPEAARACIKR